VVLHLQVVLAFPELYDREKALPVTSLSSEAKPRYQGGQSLGNLTPRTPGTSSTSARPAPDTSLQEAWRTPTGSPQQADRPSQGIPQVKPTWLLSCQHLFNH